MSISSTPNFIENVDTSSSIYSSYILEINQTAQGTVSSINDNDYYSINLVGGQTYTFALIGTGGNKLSDPYLTLLNSAGSQVRFNDDSGVGYSSLITYTATYSGIYYLGLDSFLFSSGQYGISATSGEKASFDLSMAASAIFHEGNPSWSSIGTATTLTYGFRSSGTAYDASGNVSTFSQLTLTEMQAVRKILGLWSDVANISFQEVNPGGYTNDATMLFGNYSSTTDGAGAYAYYPGSGNYSINGFGTADKSSASIDGDVWLNTTSVDTSSIPIGSYSFSTIIHEIGHALGLSHPGDYNADPDIQITYPTYSQFIQDSEQYTIMSYFAGYNTGQSPGDSSAGYTPMMVDIYQIQLLYGANMSTRSGDTVYGFSNNTGSDIYNFTNSSTPLFCIWDGGGNDTINCSGYNQNQEINLNSASFSNIGGGIENISIAYNCLIENAIGGSGNDVIRGNSLSNSISGGLGSNTLYGGAGNDSFDWEASINTKGGNDTFVGGLGNDIFCIYGNDVIVENFGEGIDTAFVESDFTLASNVENLNAFTGVSSALNLAGNSLNNQINGGGGNDYINGISGNDTIDGGAGSDTFYLNCLRSQSSGSLIGSTYTVNSILGICSVNNIEYLAFSDMTISMAGILDSIAPTIAISSNDMSLIAGETALVTFTLSEASTDFAVGDVTVSGGTLSGFSGSGTTYSATFTPEGSSNLDGVVSVSSTKFSDAAGNFNNDGSDSNNTITMAVDTIIPLIGNASANTIIGIEKNDAIFGLGGVDILNGANGSDLYIMTLASDHTKAEINDTGASGIDEVRFTSTTASTLTLFTGDLGIEQVVIGTGTAASAVTNGTTALNINAAAVTNALSIVGNDGNNILTGTVYADTLIGNAGGDTLNGGAGADTLIGGAGNDIYLVDNVGDTVTEQSGAGTDTVQSSITYTLEAFVENLTLTGSGAINATGNGLANTISGNTANNVIDGGIGADNMIGGAGNDTYYVNEAGDVMTEASKGGNDSVFSSLTTYTLGLNIENLTFDGITSSSLNFSGNTLANTITGSNGNDILDGNAGADIMLGGAGNDTYYVDNSNDAILDSSGTDSVYSTVSYTLGSGVENLLLTGTAKINGTGNELANSISGNNQSNTLTGGAGNDSLSGGAAKDILKGDAGSDTFIFSPGDSGQTTSTFDVIQDYTKGLLGTGDLIDFTSILSVGGSNATANATQASINSSNGVVTFATGSGTKLPDALADITASFSASTDSQGEFALFKINNKGDYYMFVSDGNAGVTTNDVLIQLVGVTTIGSIDLTGGNLTILT